MLVVYNGISHVESWLANLSFLPQFLVIIMVVSVVSVGLSLLANYFLYAITRDITQRFSSVPAPAALQSPAHVCELSSEVREPVELGQANALVSAVVDED